MLVLFGLVACTIGVVLAIGRSAAARWRGKEPVE
jgi:hypothetical protein